MKLVIDDKIPYIRGEAERLGEVVYLPAEDITPSAVRDADALIVRTRTLCNETLLSGSSVRFIATATIGYDHLDTAYLAQQGITWRNCPGCNAASVAQYVRSVLYLLAQDGLVNLSGATLGVVGVGHVGSKVANVGKELGCRVLLCDPPRKEKGEEGFVTLAQLAQEADIISFHTPLTKDGQHATFHLADTTFFRQLKRQPVIINSGRGEVIETEALLTALTQKQVSQAVIDVWEHEPDISLELLRHVYIGTPHIAGYSADGKACATQMALQATADFFAVPLTFSIAPPSLGIIPPADLTDCARSLLLYNPMSESEALKAAPTRFEYFRSHYPLRREQF